MVPRVTGEFGKSMTLEVARKRRKRERGSYTSFKGLLKARDYHFCGSTIFFVDRF